MKYYKEANDATPIDVPNPMMRNTLGANLQGGRESGPLQPFLFGLPNPMRIIRQILPMGGVPNLPGPMSGPPRIPGQYEEKIIVNGVPGARVYGRRYVGNLGPLAAPASAYGQPADQSPW